MSADVVAPSTLTAYLNHIQAMAGGVQFMNFDLDRILPLAHALGVTKFSCPVITVAGTNGKGSVVHGLAAAYEANGYAVAYSVSPHLECINERAYCRGKLITDEQFLQALVCVDHHRDDLNLSYFEWITLAFLFFFKQQTPDVLILEVGLGGRLDVMNVVENDCAVVTSIALDHTAILGGTREAIAKEKAGIFKYGKRVVCGEPLPPAEIASQALLMNNQAVFAKQDFFLDANEKGEWVWQMGGKQVTMPAHQQLHPNNAATIMAVLFQMAKAHPLRIDWPTLPKVLSSLVLPGRLQRLIFNESIEVILDVAHNTESVQHLCEHVHSLPPKSQTVCIFAAQAHKDCDKMAAILAKQVYRMHVAALAIDTTATAAQLLATMRALGCQDVVKHATIAQAWRTVLKEAKLSTRVVVCGSFYTVAAMLALLTA